MTADNKFFKITYWIASFLILAIGALTLISALKLCSETCNAAHDYRLYGLPFEVFGVILFFTLATIHYFAKMSKNALFLGTLVLTTSVGAESYFIYLQKYIIGAFCPVCLSIAATLFLLFICYGILMFLGGTMLRSLKNLSLIALFGFGAFTAFLGISKIDKLEAVENAIKEKIKFGDLNSPIEVYVFTDWACPACRAAEARIEAMAPAIMKKAQLTFVDTVVHPETLNYAPYNISFMVSSKGKYFQIRDALTKLSLGTKKPTDQEIAKTVAPLGVKYHELPYEDVSTCMKYFDELVDRFKITGTPTIAIVNRSAKKGKKLAGVEELTEANVINAIDALR